MSFHRIMSYSHQCAGKVSTSDVYVRAQGLTDGTTLWLKTMFGVSRIRCGMFITHNSVSRILVAWDCKDYQEMSPIVVRL